MIRRAVTVAAALVAQLLVVTPGASADPELLALRVSDHADRSSYRALHGATVVGQVAIFASKLRSATFQQVTFYLDDPDRTGAPFSVDSAYPFDFNGTVPCSLPACPTADAVRWDTVPLRQGTHRVTAVAELAGGAGTSVATAAFVVVHPASEPPRVYPEPVPGGVRTGVVDATRFLYTGELPPQAGVDPATIDADRAAVVRGRVVERDGDPLPNVSVAVVGHTEYGSTRTRADGWFDLVVNGGQQLVVSLSRTGYVTAHRAVDPPWQGWLTADQTVLVPYDTASTSVDPDAIPAGDFAVAQATAVTDADGTRRSTLLVPSGVDAELVLPDGSHQPVGTLTLRQTELTVGDSGPDAMPAPLPATSAYTYAVDLSLDEARAAGAVGVEFSAPLWHYNENFLGFPAGTVVPAGRYDYQRKGWVGSANGLVVTVVSESAGLADVDLTGDGVAEGAAARAAIGLTDEERAKLAALYGPGDSLWRVPVDHFSPWDFNWGFGLAVDAIFPILRGLSGLLHTMLPNCTAAGSVIGCEAQTLGEEVDLVGTGASLVYSTGRVPGYRGNSALTFLATPASVPASLDRVEVEVQVAGRRFTETLAAAPNARFTFDWDGRDAFDRYLNGTQVATVRVRYVYDGVDYAATSSFGAAGGAPLDGDPTRREIFLDRSFTTELSPSVVADSRGDGLGGWTLSVHHTYDPLSRTVALGTGRSVRVDPYGSAVTTLAGSGTPGSSGDAGAATAAALHFPGGAAYDGAGNLYVSDTFNDRVRRVAADGTITTVAGTGGFGFSGDGGPATSARLRSPLELAVGPDGSVYVADVDNHRIRRISPTGTITTVAGSGVRGYLGDGGPAAAARLAEPTGVAVAPDGSLYVADFANHRVRRVDPGGTISTVAGSGVQGFSGDGGPALAARLHSPSSVAVDASGAVYVADSGNRRVRRVAPDGRIATVAGNGSAGSTGDGLAATAASMTQPTGVALDADGNLFVADKGAHRVRRVSPQGVILTVAGTGVAGFSGDGALSVKARLSRPRAVAVAPDGTLVVVDAGNHRLRGIGPARPRGSTGSLLVPSPGGEQVFEFDAAGRHLRTYDSLTGVTLHTFAYDPAGRLIGVTDVDGNAVSITRPSATQVLVESPDGLVTELTLDANGWLSGIETPGGRTHAVTYHGTGGLLDAFTDRNGETSSYDYDASGRLASATGRDDETTTLERTPLDDGVEVTVTTPMGRDTVYTLTEDTDGTVHRTVTDTLGTLRTDERRRDGTSVVTSGGTTLTEVLAPDPRWGMSRPRPATSTVQAAGHAPVTAVLGRTVTLSDPDDPLSLAASTDTYTVGSRVWSTVWSKSAGTVTSTSPEGRTSVTTLDAEGHVVSRQDGDLLAVSYGYDGRGRLTSVSRGSGAAERKTVVAYRPDGFVDTVTDALGQVTTYTPDTDGRPVTVAGPLGTLGTAYDGNDNPTSVTPPGRPAYALAPAVDDRLSGYTVPDADAAADGYGYTLNDDRQYSGATLPSGTTVSFSRDTAGRLSGIAHGPAALSISWTGGRFASMTSPGGVVSTAAYTSGLRTGTTWSGAVSGSVSVVFDDEMRVASETVGGTSAVAYARDDDGLLTGAGGLTLSRDAETGLLSGTSVGSTTTTVGHSGFGELDSFVAKYGGSTLYEAVVGSRDKAGREVSRTETIGGATATATYEYYASGRLKRVLVGGVETAAFSYDAAGNLTSESRGGVTTSSAYDAQDRIGSRGVLSYGYDADGQRTSTTDTGSSAVTSYDWSFGRLAGVDLPGGTAVDYLYDGEGRRVGRKVGGSLVAGYLWSGRRLVAVTDAAGVVTSRFVYGSRAHVPDLLVRGGVTYRLVTDERGSVRLVVNTATGVVVQRVDYDEWGRVVADSAPGFQPFGFAGGLVDPDTGLVRFGARDYDPVSVQWLSRDVIGFSGGTNHYAYADGDPVNRIDPSGYAALGCLSDLLGLAGMIPVIGGAFDAANVLVLLADGRWGDIALALAAVALPVSIAALKGTARYGKLADEVAEAGATPWFEVTKAGANRAGTLVPESFELTVAAQKFSIVPNATKHMAEYATSTGASSLPFSSFAGAIEKAVEQGLSSGRNFLQIGPWELGIDATDNVIYHAVYRP